MLNQFIYIRQYSSACICFLTKHEGGTAYTVDYEKQNGLYIINVVEEFEGQPSLFLDYPFIFLHISLLRLGFQLVEIWLLHIEPFSFGSARILYLPYACIFLRLPICRVPHPFFCHIDWHSGCLTVGAESVSKQAWLEVRCYD